jgi:hypothetical protein
MTTVEGTAFAYSAEQWDEVAGAIPATMAADIDLMLTVRQKLEEAASDYLAMKQHQRKRFAKGSLTVRTLRARDQIKAALDYAAATDNAPLKAVLGDALRTMDATTQVKALDMLRLSRKGRSDPDRDLLHLRVLTTWTNDLAGALTVGRSNSGRRKANSPATRFLIAVLKPLVVIGPEAAEKIIEAERAGLARVRRLIGDTVT